MLTPLMSTAMFQLNFTQGTISRNHTVVERTVLGNKHVVTPQQGQQINGCSVAAFLTVVLGVKLELH